METSNRKIYWSISEVAEMFQVAESNLRYWEKEFSILNPKKTAGNTRQYRQEDLEAVKLIRHLVKEKGLTIAAAKKRLKYNKEMVDKTAEVVIKLKAIREEFLSIKMELDRLSTSENVENPL